MGSAHVLSGDFRRQLRNVFDAIALAPKHHSHLWEMKRSRGGGGEEEEEEEVVVVVDGVKSQRGNVHGQQQQQQQQQVKVTWHA